MSVEHPKQYLNRIYKNNIMLTGREQNVLFGNKTR